MKCCPNCASEIVDEGWNCSSCNWRAPEKDGITLLSEIPPGRNENYDPAWYEELASLEDNNFWFRSRNDLIEHFATRFLGARLNYLEIGCGTGFVLKRMQEAFSHWAFSATELHHEGLLYARDRVPKRVRFLQMDAQSIPFRAEFDVIGAFDVIEHIQDDRNVLLEIHRALKPDGYLLLTVPQHMWLWSQYDEIACHFRRYTRNELREKVHEAGFEIVREASFNSFLIPAMFVSKKCRHRRTRRAQNLASNERLSRTNFAPRGPFDLAIPYRLACGRFEDRLGKESEYRVQIRANTSLTAAVQGFVRLGGRIIQLPAAAKTSSITRF